MRITRAPYFRSRCSAIGPRVEQVQRITRETGARLMTSCSTTSRRPGDTSPSSIAHVRSASFTTCRAARFGAMFVRRLSKRSTCLVEVCRNVNAVFRDMYTVLPSWNAFLDEPQPLVEATSVSRNAGLKHPCAGGRLACRPPFTRSTVRQSANIP